MKILLFYSKKFDLTTHAIDFINKNFKEHEFIFINSYEQLKEELPDTDIFITGKFTQDMLKYSRKLKWVNALSAGVDNYDLELFRNNNIIFTNSSGIHKIQMAEYAIMSMIMFMREMKFFINNQNKHTWDFNIHQGEIHSKTVGILGLGTIGMQTARYAHSLGMKVIGMNTTGNNTEYFIENVYTLKNIDIILKNSDFLINLLPSTKDTHNFLTLEKMSLMKKSAYFINMGRGDITTLDVLYKILSEKIIAGAMCDVFEIEPLPENSPLWKLENLVITPHICGSSDIYMEKALKQFKDNFDNYINKKEMFNLIK